MGAYEQYAGYHYLGGGHVKKSGSAHYGRPPRRLAEGPEEFGEEMPDEGGGPAQGVLPLLLTVVETYQQDLADMISVPDDSPEKQRIQSLITRIKLAEESLNKRDEASVVDRLIADLESDFDDFSTQPFFQASFQQLESLSQTLSSEAAQGEPEPEPGPDADAGPEGDPDLEGTSLEGTDVEDDQDAPDPDLDDDEGQEIPEDDFRELVRNLK